MKQTLRLLFFTVSCLLLSCDYSPSGSHYEEVNPNPEVVGEISLNQYEDTIRVRGNIRLNFKISLPGRQVYGYALKFNNGVLAQGNTSTGTHLFESTKYRDGYYTMQLVAVGNSGTGSLADRNGAEAVEVYRTWIAQIDNTPPRQVAITSIKPENGQLRIEWEEYKGAGFERYQIIRKSGDGFYSQYSGTVTDPGETYWIDDTYIGGKVTYTVSVYVNGQNYGVNSPAVPYDSPLPFIRKSTYNAANELILSISSTPFYKNFGKYTLYLNYNLAATISDWRDTTFTVAAPAFGGDMEARLFVQPKKTEGLSNYFINPAETTIPSYGTEWGPHEVKTLVRRPSTNRFYALTGSDFKVIDANSLQVQHVRNVQYQQLEGNIKNAISEDGRYFYAVLENVLHKLDPATLQSLETYKLADLLPAESYYSAQLGGCSNSNRLLIYTKDVNSDFNATYLVDMNLKQVLVKKEARMYAENSSLSPDGKFFRTDNILYSEQSNGTWQQLNFSAYEARGLKYHPTKPLFYITNGKDYYVTEENKIVFYSTVNGTRQKTLTTEVALVDCQIDAGSGYLFGFHYNTLYVYNIDTGQLVRKQELAVRADAFVYKDRIFSHNRYTKL